MGILWSREVSSPISRSIYTLLTIPGLQLDVMSETDTTNESNQSNDDHWLVKESPEAWESTEFERVYFRTEQDQRSGLAEYGQKVATEFPEWVVVIECGPYRAYSVQYRGFREQQRIQLDFHSGHPGTEFIGNVIRDIHESLQEDR